MSTARPVTFPKLLRAVVVAALASALVPAWAAAQAAPGRSPWATINACDPPQRPASVGVRVSVPNRRDAEQWVRIRMQFFDATRRAWRVVQRGGDAGLRKLSDGGGRVMGGTTFLFTAPKPGVRLKVRGIVDFEWRRRQKVLARARVFTTSGHALPGDALLAVSQGSCQIAR